MRFVDFVKNGEWTGPNLRIIVLYIYATYTERSKDFHNNQFNDFKFRSILLWCIPT